MDRFIVEFAKIVCNCSSTLKSNMDRFIEELPKLTEIITRL